MILSIFNYLPTHLDILMKFSGSHIILSGAMKPKFPHVSHRSQGVMN